MISNSDMMVSLSFSQRIEVLRIEFSGLLPTKQHSAICVGFYFLTFLCRLVAGV
jgi:hypothetical protein